ncbi:MAG: DNA-processing protein DprA [Armatimonadetes bacterium]|nr:DNA-processing protein DprA [Armatimonadota bacterium]
MLDRRQLHGTLAWMRVPHVGDRCLATLLEYGRTARLSLADLWAVPARDLRRLIRLHPRACDALEQRAAELWEQAAEDARLVRERGVEVLVATDVAYPARLRVPMGRDARAWPILFTYGALDLLEEPLAAVVNSADVTPEGLAQTDVLADELARRDVALVAGINKESYRMVAVAAKRQAGPAVLVLDRGLCAAFPAGLGREPIPAARIWASEMNLDTQILLSPFALGASWTNRNGRRRDALIFDLAQAIIAVDVRPTGTMDRECRRAARRGIRVLAVDRGPATAEGTRRLWEDGVAERVQPDRAAIAATRALPALENDRLRRHTGWRREVARLLVSLALARTQASGRQPRREVLLLPAQGTVRAAADPTPLGPLLRGPAPTGPLDLAVADFTDAHPHATGMGKALEIARRLRTGGLLAAVVPAAWLVDTGHADWRHALLNLGSPVLIAHLPSRLPLEPAASPEPAVAVLLFERGVAPVGEVPVLSPDRGSMTRSQLRRYLWQVFEAEEG